MASVFTGSALFAELSKIIDLPPRVLELTLHLAVDQCAEVKCTFHASREVDVTALDSHAHDHALVPTLLTKRYRLVEIQEKA